MCQLWYSQWLIQQGQRNESKEKISEPVTADTDFYWIHPLFELHDALHIDVSSVSVCWLWAQEILFLFLCHTRSLVVSDCQFLNCIGRKKRLFSLGRKSGQRESMCLPVCQCLREVTWEEEWQRAREVPGAPCIVPVCVYNRLFGKASQPVNCSI